MKLIDTFNRAPLRIGFGRRGGGGSGGALTLVRDADSMTLVPGEGLAVLLPPASTDKAGVLTAAERAAIAGLAAGGSGTGLAGSRAAIAGMVLDAGTTAVLAAGFAVPGDGGGALYVRAAAEPAHALKVRSGDRILPDGSTSAGDGGWWEIAAEGGLDIRAAGAVGDGVADDSAAFAAAAGFLAARAAAGRPVPPLLLPAGRFRVTAPGALSDGFAGAGGPDIAVQGAGPGASEIVYAPPAPAVLNAGAPAAGAGSTVTAEAPGVWRVTRNGGGNPRAAWSVPGLVPGRRYAIAGRVLRGTVPDDQAIRVRVADSATLSGLLRAETRIARGGERFRLTFQAAAETQHFGALAETGGAAGWFEMEGFELFDARTALVETGALGQVTLSGLALTCETARAALVVHRGGPAGTAGLLLRDVRIGGPVSVAVETLGAPAVLEDVSAALPGDAAGTVLLASPEVGRPPARLGLARCGVRLPGPGTAVELRDGAKLDWSGGEAALGDGATFLKARGAYAAASVAGVAPAAAGLPGTVRWLDAEAAAGRFLGMAFAGAGTGGAPAFLVEPDAEARPVVVFEDCRLSAAETMALSDGALLRFDRCAMEEWQVHVVSVLRREGGQFASPQVSVRGRVNGPDADPFATERAASGTAVPTAPLVLAQPAPKLMVHRRQASGAEGGLAFATGAEWGEANPVPVPLGSVVTRLRVVWNGPALPGDTAARRVRAEAADGTVLIPETEIPAGAPAVVDSGPLWLRLPDEAMRVLSVLGRVEAGAPGGVSLDHAHAVVEYL